jgi:hypothetical protein
MPQGQVTCILVVLGDSISSVSSTDVNEANRVTNRSFSVSIRIE